MLPDAMLGTCLGERDGPGLHIEDTVLQGHELEAELAGELVMLAVLMMLEALGVPEELEVLKGLEMLEMVFRLPWTAIQSSSRAVKRQESNVGPTKSSTLWTPSAELARTGRAVPFGGAKPAGLMESELKVVLVFALDIQPKPPQLRRV